MRRHLFGIVCAFLALFVFLTFSANAASVSGEVLYRQKFSDVSTLAAAGITLGERNTATSQVSIADGWLKLGDPSGDRAFALLPFYNCSTDYTVRFSFSFTEAVRQSGYVSLILTSRGNAPENITAVKIRADGQCEGFSPLSQRLVYAIKNGENISLSVPVSDGLLDSITVSADGVSETVNIDNITDVVEGRIGFSVRNCTVRISETAVIEGVEYDKETGVYSKNSTWTDEMPYVSQASCARGDGAVYAHAGLNEDVSAPVTGDVSVVFIIVACMALSYFMYLSVRCGKVKL